MRRDFRQTYSVGLRGLKPCNNDLKIKFTDNQYTDKTEEFTVEVYAYDYDGKKFPCHMFTRIVHGEYPVDFFKEFEFEHPLKSRIEPCNKCVLRQHCPTCIGCNFQHRGKLNAMDTRRCRLHLVEMKVISTFQILYMTRKEVQHPLDEVEKLILQRALSTYDLVKNLKFSNFIQK